MKYYTFIVKVTNGDKFKDVEDFINRMFNLEVDEVVEVDNKKYRISMEAEDDHDFGYFEDRMDNEGYDTELLYED